jgi:outer membrane protein assembly factor BamB
MVFRAALIFLVSLAAQAENWPQWRGPSGDGVSREADVPFRWSATENVLWKTPLEGLGTSTPIVWDERVFLTSQVGNAPSAGGRDFQEAQAAKSAGAGSGVTFLVSAFARGNGRLLWEKRFEADGYLPEVHVKHNLASPSCVTDGERVYAWFGTGLVVALSLDGVLLWKRHLGQERSRFDVRWGHGSSPALYDNALLLLVDHPGDSSLLAVDTKSGKDLWRSERGVKKRSYTTPFVIRRENGDQLIINTNDRIEAVDPSDGRLLWHVGRPNRVPIAMPVHHDGVLYSNRGYFSAPYLAVRVDGQGGVTESKLQWRVPTGGPYVSSLVYHRGLLFMATERGIASAIDAETGQTVWKERLGGVFTVSPVAANGQVYFVEESGKTYVVEAAREFKLVSLNDLGGRTLASPAISNGMLFLRTDNHLFAIGKR